MKKLFISCPMEGRTKENVKNSMERMHKVAELIFDEKLEVISSDIEEEPPENSNASIWHLGKSIELISEADYFIGIEYCDFWKGCDIEKNVAMQYGIPSTFVAIREFMPDAWKIQQDAWNNTISVCSN